eukprot:1534318-Amphidinium_carterae.1
MALTAAQRVQLMDFFETMAAQSTEDAPPVTEDTQPTAPHPDTPRNVIDDLSPEPQPSETELQSAPHAPTEASTTSVPPDERRSLEPLHREPQPYSQATPVPSDFRAMPRASQTYSRDAASMPASSRIQNIRPASVPVPSATPRGPQLQLIVDH